MSEDFLSMIDWSFILAVAKKIHTRLLFTKRSKQAKNAKSSLRFLYLILYRVLKIWKDVILTGDIKEQLEAIHCQVLWKVSLPPGFVRHNRLQFFRSPLEIVVAQRPQRSNVPFLSRADGGTNSRTAEKRSTR
jgi:hypothetical protein